MPRPGTRCAAASSPGSTLSGQRPLYARGNLDLAIAFEGLFQLEDGRKPLLRIHDVQRPGRRISTLTMGAGSDVLLLHGLDLPGFGSSSKPATAPYTARWFAETVLETMDALGIERAHVAGNSMGGRVAIELGLRAPERVVSLALLAPAVAFVKRTYHPIVRLVRPELGLGDQAGVPGDDGAPEVGADVRG